jgi:hypothetical protein
MNNSDLTLRNFFDCSNEVIQREWPPELESGSAIPDIKGKVRTEVHGVQWPAALDEIKKSVEPLLNVGIPDIMAAAWNKYRLLCKYLDRDKYPPDKTVMVPLAEHTLKSEHRPTIEIYINDHLIGKVNFVVTVSLAFEGLILKIRDGRIMEMLTGSCTGKGAISCENCLLIERATAPFPLPGSIKLGDGIPIA